MRVDGQRLSDLVATAREARHAGALQSVLKRLLDHVADPSGGRGDQHAERKHRPVREGQLVTQQLVADLRAVAVDDGDAPALTRERDDPHRGPVAASPPRRAQGSSSPDSGTPSARMHSRWVNPGRIYSQDQELTQPAASFGCCFQAGIPYAQIVWPAASANSQLASALQEAASQSTAQGIMVRFTSYVNVYFKNGILNGISAQPRSYEDLADLLATVWEAWNNNGDPSQFFSQPCYSHVVGVVGVSRRSTPEAKTCLKSSAMSARTSFIRRLSAISPSRA